MEQALWNALGTLLKKIHWHVYKREYFFQTWWITSPFCNPCNPSMLKCFKGGREESVMKILFERFLQTLVSRRQLFFNKIYNSAHTIQGLSARQFIRISVFLNLHVLGLPFKYLHLLSMIRFWIYFVLSLSSFFYIKKCKGKTNLWKYVKEELGNNEINVKTILLFWPSFSHTES